jgi:lipid-A-disaccharide synthase-like uncharacterized protein
MDAIVHAAWFIISSLKDPWVIFGFFAQFVFFLRFLIQWFLSEKHGKIVIPKLFWHLSIAGAVLILIYAIHRQDPVFMASASLQLVLFSRSLFIELKSNRKESLDPLTA